MADARGLDLDQDFAGARSLELNGHDFKRLSGLNGDSGANVHAVFSLWIFVKSDAA